MYRPAQELGAAFSLNRPTGASGGFRIGSRSSRQGSGAAGARQANRYDGQSHCPPGQEVVSHGSTPHAPKYIGGPTSTPYVYCKPIPATAPAPPPPAPNINVQTQVSPTLQTQISPQISPVFSQMQDSPGATQAATTAQVQPGGMTASPGGGGGNGASQMLEFMRLQAELDRERRAEERAQQERERQAMLERQAEAQKVDLQNREAARQEQLRQQAAAQKAADERQAQMDKEWRDAQAAQQAAYEKALEQRPQGTPSSFTSTPAVMPGRQMIDPELDTIVIDKGLPQESDGLNWLLIGGGLLLAGGVYYLSTKKGKR